MIPVDALFEAHLTVTDLDRAIEFYRHVVGLRVAHITQERQAAFFWVGSSNGGMLGLWTSGSAPQRPFAVRRDHAARLRWPTDRPASGSRVDAGRGRLFSRSGWKPARVHRHASPGTATGLRRRPVANVGIDDCVGQRRLTPAEGTPMLRPPGTAWTSCVTTSASRFATFAARLDLPPQP
jgi:catechol 2,3-dioxygenase-like lactoylglutathione lyase family enzyme